MLTGRVGLLVTLLVAGSTLADAGEQTITLAGQVDVAALGASPGGFAVRALRAQKRSVELAKAVTDAAGRFRLSIEEEAVGVYGVVLEATSVTEPALVLEAAVLTLEETKAPVAVDPASTVAAAILDWKVQRHEENLDHTRPFLLLEWIRPLLGPKARNDLRRAEIALVQWARAAAPASGSLAAVLKAGVGDVRNLGARLAPLNVAPQAIARLEEMARKDPEVAYLLMLPYLLEL
ncbi:MAG: hypothetical protein HY713_10790 [candidate division NC10 bacterium]|nr:hypothetical protein [candidate division NC10 bacterium]